VGGKSTEKGCKTDKPLKDPLPLEPTHVQDGPEEECEGHKEHQQSNVSGSNVMQITKCPHTKRKHYAKNMCSSCYRKFGRNQNAWKCEHTDRLLYSMGMCQTCYLADYHKKRTQIKRERKEAE